MLSPALFVIISILKKEYVYENEKHFRYDRANASPKKTVRHGYVRSTRGGGTCLNAPDKLLRHSEFNSESINFDEKNINRFRVYPRGTLPCKTCAARQQEELKHGMTNKAFTLAEVLITLGIIGVVAALTLPTLISNHRQKEVVTKLEKIYTVMNQAVLLAEVENGDLADWYPDCGPSSAYTCSADDVMKWYNQYLAKHLNTTKVVKSTKRTDNIELYFPDGSILCISPWVSDMYFLINEKALDNPISGRNGFTFNFAYNKAENNAQWASVKGKKFELYSWNWDGTREGLLTTVNGYGCGEAKNAYCGKLIQYDGWQISKDYPLKF